MAMRDIDVSRSQQPVRVLIYSPHTQVLDQVKFTFPRDIYHTRTATEATGAADLLREWAPQLAVIDMDGGVDLALTRIGLARDSHRTNIPVLALTRNGDIKNKLTAYTRGVDDVIIYPFAPEELQARMLVMARRTVGDVAPIDPVLRLGNLEIDLLGRRVSDGSSALRLSGTEQSLLCLLAAHAGEVVSHDQILDALWGSDYVPDSNVVGRLIYRLRAKLQKDWRRPRSIVTVPGLGYRFVPELLTARRAPARPRVSAGRATAVAAQGERRPLIETARISRR